MPSLSDLDPADFDKVEPTADRPWGDSSPEGGFKVGDVVNLAYSDHDEYIFDNPRGVVVAVDEDEEYDEPDRVTVAVEATLPASRVLLIARPKAGG
jgi:hypothetical protein